MRPGTYVFTYNPLAVPTVEWHPIREIIETNSFTLTALDILGIDGFRFRGNNINQQSVGTTLDTAIANGAFNQRFYDIAALSSAGIANALTQLSGEHAASAARASFQSLNSFMALTLDPWQAVRCGGNEANGDFGPALGYNARQAAPRLRSLAPPDPKREKDRPCSEREWSIWTAGYGAQNTTRGEFTVAGTHNTRILTGGAAAGADYRVWPGTVAGFAVAGSGSNWSLSDGLGGGTSDIMQTAIYGSTRFGAAYLSAVLAYGFQRTQLNRTVTIFTSDQFRANFPGHTFGNRVETGYRFGMDGYSVTPYAAMQVQHFRSPSFSETTVYGLPDFALDYSSRKATSGRFEFGTWIDQHFPVETAGTLALRGRVGWIYDWQSQTSIGASFPNLPGASFYVLGANPATNIALASGAAELKLKSGMSFSAKLDTEFGYRSFTLSGTGTIKYEW